MSDPTPIQSRRSRRSNLFMSAQLQYEGALLPVRLRNLSREGALVEGAKLPHEGSHVVFIKGELEAGGTIAWARDNRAGINFEVYLDPDAVLRHIGPPRR